MTIDGVYFGEETADNILEAVDIVQRSGDTVVEYEDQTLSTNQFWYVKLTADLASPADHDSPTTATANVWNAKDDDTLEDSAEEITVTNRFTGFSALSAALVAVVLEEGEYIPISPPVASEGGGGASTCGCCETVEYADVNLSDGIATTSERTPHEQMSDIREIQEHGILTITFPVPNSMFLEKEEGSDDFVWTGTKWDGTISAVYNDATDATSALNFNSTVTVTFSHNVPVEEEGCGCPTMRCRIEWVDSDIPAPF